ncbi:LodA/GoxA family CTQ-dependent oxidase [Bradyrhizobium sp. 2TAF24]|uniref:LodA/GoxA family CTQ-dependent oxidase n=1 Tax=Bradyrhizobium sp. 2TAF24 TaxID=3233011 RepID=UPI003F8E1E7A
MSVTNPPIPPCFDCGDDPINRLIEMFVDIAQKKRIRLGQTPAERPVFRKLHGTAHGRLEMAKNIPADLKVGVFAHDSLVAWMRFSSDTSPTSPDLQSTVGIGLKVFGVPGEKAYGGAGDTADFIMQNYPVFFVDNAKEMCEFTYAGVVQGDYPTYLAHHPKTKRILDEMAKVEGSVLTTTYWGILPFGAGEKQAVKYRLDPETPPENVANDAPNYLATDMANRLLHGEYRFRFMVQRRTNPATMPLDEATVEWPESESPFIQIATLIIPRQDVEDRGQADYGQSLAFNIFRVPPAQAPVPESSIAAVRRAVYAASANTRHEANGQPLHDPPQPRQAHLPPDTPPDTCVVKAVIYPSIGIARVGNSPDEWYLGPETPDPEPLPAGAYRDKHGRLKRQAARFRIYGVNAKGEIVRELTGKNDDVAITWSVELANTKSAWYGFQLALDIPEAASAPPTVLRNAAVADRTRLAITPGSREAAGRHAKPKAFDSGEFMGRKVYLGEISTDDEQRLIVLGGHGKSASCDGTWAITFANNEGWHDDISDGPVTAKVTLDGTPLEVIPAWVVVAPPNFGPQRKSVRTMWDLMRDVAITAGTLAAPKRPSFTRDILPIFQRMAGLQWVNAGFAAGFGWRGAFDFSTPDGIAKLADPGPAYQEFRRVLSNSFRRFAVDSWSPKPWPWLYGDAMNIPPAPTPRQNCALSNCQLAMLDQWAAGNFDADYKPHHVPPSTIDKVPLAEQGDVLTKAALEFCLADAFHPGCEMTWPVRTATMYMAPFRFAHVLPDWVAPNLGETLTSDSMTIPNGPLYGQIPGGITRWMAVPWQTDSASCRSGYVATYDPYVPAFWPARVPDQVLTKDNYDIVMDHKRPLSERRAAFANRAAWIDPLGTTSYTDQINNMIEHFDHLGVVEVHPGPKDTDAFPAVIEVEDRRATIHDVIPKSGRGPRSLRSPAHQGATHAGAPGTNRRLDISGIDKFRRFPLGLPVQFK